MDKNWLKKVFGSFIGTCLAILAVTFSARELQSMNAASDLALPVLTAPTLSPNYSQDCTNAWVRYPSNTGISAYVTLNADSNNATNSAVWRPTIPVSGYYTIEAYIPPAPAITSQTCSWIGSVTQNTTQAKYTVSHSGGSTSVTVNQAASAGSWVNLGSFHFTAGTSGFVQLRDLNDEIKFTRFVLFGDMRFTPSQTVIYMPIISKEILTPTPPPPPPGSVVVTRNRQAFDSCYRPTTSQMKTWWDQSPYYIYNLYLGGVSNASCHPETLTASWVQTVRDQGWEFIPTWVGPQAPCTTFKYRFSMDPSNAFGEGIYEAELAFARAVSLGLTGAVDPSTVLYYDMEAFYGGSAECRLAVQSFLSGWSQRLHELGARSGVYGSSCYYMPDWKALSNPLDDAWLASWYKVDHDNDEATPKIYYYYPYAGVWDVSCSSSLSNAWTNQQRIRQYAGGHNESWGGVTVNIDSNIVDGRVVSPFSAAAPDLPQTAADQPLSLLATASEPAIRESQLVGPGQGWVIEDDQLLWTNDGGLTWVDRTPSNIFARWLGVFFRDDRTGWALVADSARDGESGWHVLRTVDGGESWQAAGIAVDPDLAGMGEAAYFDFLDANQGWLSIRLYSSSAFSRGVLFFTQDGGQSWQPRSVPLGEAVNFIDPLTGWVAGGASGDELFVTRDGGFTWEPAAFIQVEQNAVFYSLPEFSDPINGILSVTVADPGQPRVEVYRSQDSGRSWQPSGVIPLDDQVLPGAMAPVAAVDAQSVLAVDVQADRLVAVELTASLLRREGTFSLPDGVVKMEFATPLQGWAKAELSTCSGSKSDGTAQPFACQVQEALYQTEDGGATWTQIR